MTPFLIGKKSTLIIDFNMWVWLPSYLPISFIHIFITTTSAKARQNKAICFYSIFYYALRSAESKPSVSITLKLTIFWYHTPFVHLFLSYFVFNIGKIVPNALFINVLFPVLCVPKIAIVADALGNYLSYSL